MVINFRRKIKEKMLKYILRMMGFRIITTKKLMINNKMMMLFMKSMIQMILIVNVLTIITIKV